MAERTRIGLIFSYDENWIAGAYYILNIIHALNTIEDDLKPHVVVLSQKEENFDIVKSETQYPYLSYFKFPIRPNYSVVERAVNKAGRIIIGENLIVKIPIPPPIDFLYPDQHESVQIKGLKKVNWIPDFQEVFLPHLFSNEQVTSRKKYQQEILCKGDFVVFSSENAKSHYLKLYPEAKAETVVLPFAVTHPDFSNQHIDSLKTTYNLPENYFFAPNQFWEHKNHKVILNAIKELKLLGEEIVVAFSGKENDYRNINYVQELKSFVIENNLEENIRFLGFIDRTEQLCIMKNAIAIIQPSLFEGWSTVVEDAKSLSKHIVLSNLEVHKEQIKENVSFFDPHNTKELTVILKLLHLRHPHPSVDGQNNYKQTINTFGKAFLALVNKAKI